VIVFGGAYLDPTTNMHNLVDGHLWLFDLDKLEWSKLSSLTMARPTYFHAAAINEVIAHKIFLFIFKTIVFSVVKYGHTEVLQLNHCPQLMKHV
jgi:hypothetical protein